MSVSRKPVLSPEEWEKRRIESKRRDYENHREKYIAKAKAYYQKNRTKRLEQIKDWSKRNPARRLEIQAKYRANHKQQAHEHYVKSKFYIGQDEWNARQRANKRRQKVEMLTHYSGGIPKCACCGETLIEFLTIDHIQGRKAFGHPRALCGEALHRWIRKNEYPSGFQVLCWNCNAAKGMFGGCPHQKERIPLEVVN